MKILTKVLVWMINKSFEGKNRNQIEPCIIDLYRKIAKEDLEIESKIVKVKKGDRRYSILFMETPKGETKIRLNRNWQSHLPIDELIEKSA